MKKVRLGGNVRRNVKTQTVYREKRSQIKGFSIVDNNDFIRVSNFSWYKVKRGKVNYAVAWVNGEKIYLHRFIMECKNGEMIDHINRDGLDNRKNNLRFSSKSENSVNTGLRYDNKSGHKGIYWDKRTNKWMVKITRKKKMYWLGRFFTKNKAIEAYREADERLS